MRLTKKGGQDMDTLKILVVDDESRMRKLVKDFLTKKNFQVLEAGDGEEAMDIFYEEKDIALIILDVMMPKMDGWEVCREIRKNSKVPIIMLTARSDERDELLGCTQEDIRALADYMDAIMKENAVCVVGNGQTIEENKEMFGTIENLFH